MYLKNHLGPRIRKDHPDVKIYIHDGQKFHDVPIKNRVDDILKAVGGLESGFVDGVAFHWYGDNLKNFQYLGDLRAAYPDLCIYGGFGCRETSRWFPDVVLMAVFATQTMCYGPASCHF